MGTVYEVEDLELGGRCALKVMRNVADHSALLRFKREFRSVAQIHHPNLLRLFELSAVGDAWFYTMELVDGVDLLTALHRARIEGKGTEPARRHAGDTVEQPGREHATDTRASDAQAADGEGGEPAAALPPTPCDLERLARLLPQLLDALEWLHEHGLVHRDLKPENILVDRHDRLRVLDFGIVQELAAYRVTGAGNVIGTIAYMSPEQCADEEVTAASDLYSLGCLLFQLLTGEPPFGRGSLRVAVDHQVTEPPQVSSRVSGVPARYDALCNDLLAKDPAARPTIADVRRRLGLVTAPLVAAQPKRAVEATFVGRRHERAVLDRCLATALEGRVSMVFVEGPSGVGKSALARAAGESARSAGFAIFSGRCYERESVPFRAFDRVMDELALHLRDLGPERLRLLAPLIERASWLFPTIGVVTSDLAMLGPRAPVVEARAQAPTPAVRLHLAMASFEVLISELAELSPLMIVVDDLQWTDDESLTILEALLRSGVRLLLVALFRNEGVSGTHPLVRFFAEHEADPAVERIDLGPMATDELATVIHDSAAGAVDADRAEVLATRIPNNPFVAVQVGTLLRHPRVRAQLDARWESITIGELVSLRFSELALVARKLVDIVACAGGALDRLVLADACELPAAAFDAATTSLVDERIFAVIRTGTAALGRSEPFAYDFYHDCFRETAYEALSADRRRELHRSLAEALERSGGDLAEALWHHWTEAGDRDWAARYALRAAEGAATTLAFKTAAELYAEYLAVRPERDDEEAEARWAILERMGDLLELSGDLEGALEARGDALASLSAGRSSVGGGSLDERRLRRGRVHCLLNLKRYAEGRAELETLLRSRGLSIRRSRPGLIARILVVQLRVWWWDRLPSTWGRRPVDPDAREWLDLLELMMSVVITTWVLDGAEYALRYRLASRRMQGEGGVRPVCMQVIQHTLLYCPDAKKQARLSRRIDQAEASHDVASLEPRERCLLSYARGAIALHRDPAAAHAHLEDAIGFLDRAGLVEAYEAATSRCIAVWAAEAAGLYDEGLAHCRVLDRFPTSLAALTTTPFRVRSHLMRGELSAAQSLLDGWRQALPTDTYTTEHFWLRLLTVQVRLARGEVGPARLDELEGLRASARWTGDLLPSWPRSHYLAVSLDARLALLGAGELSRREARRARRMAKKLARDGWTPLRAAGMRASAILAVAAGRREAARRDLHTALRLARRHGGPWQQWLTLRVAKQVSSQLSAEADEETRALAQQHRFVASRLLDYERILVNSPAGR